LPAKKGGIIAGDVIVKINGKEIKTAIRSSPGCDDD